VPPQLHFGRRPTSRVSECRPSLRVSPSKMDLLTRRMEISIWKYRSAPFLNGESHLVLGLRVGVCFWDPTNVNPVNNDYVYPTWLDSGGWRVVTSGDPGTILYGEDDIGYCSRDDDYMWAKYTPWIYSGLDGTQNSFSVYTEQAYSQFCPGTGYPSASGYATDGSGYYISITNYTNATVYAPDGTVVSSPPSTISYGKTDPNGNYYTQAGYAGPPWSWSGCFWSAACNGDLQPIVW